jgi:RimJ/RimL family protein N-acetyltransferase
MHAFLATDRLILRRLTEADLDHLVALDSDPEVMAFLSGGPPAPREATEALLRELIAAYGRFRGLGTFAAIEKTTGDFIGWMAISADGSDEVDLGYRLHTSAWGKGYATEGARALIAAAFADAGIARVYATTMAVNVRSRGVMERAGLRFVRTFHLHFDDPIPGTEFGEVEYAVTRTEWEASQ